MTDVFLRSGEGTPSNVVVYSDVTIPPPYVMTWTDLYILSENAPIRTQVKGSNDIRLYTGTAPDVALQLDSGIVTTASQLFDVILRTSGPIGAAPDHPVTGVGGIPTAEAFGLPTVGDLGITGVGQIASAEAFGSPAVQAQVNDAGIVSAEAVGAPTLSAGVTLSGIVSAEALGTPVVSARINTTGIVTAEAVGSPAVGTAITDVGGIVSAEAFGQPVVSARVVDVGGIVSQEAVGAPTVGFNGITGVGGISSLEAFGFLIVKSEFGYSINALNVGDEYGNLFAQRTVVKTPEAVDITAKLGDDYGGD